MARYLLRRFISMILAIWVVATLTFFIMKALPGGPFAREKAIPPSILANIEASYHLNDPLLKQYADYMVRLVKWDLGPSFKQKGRTVNEIISDHFPVSAQLGLSAVFLSLIVGIPAGIISALRQNKWQDQLAMFLSVVGVSVPSFVMAALLMYVFALKLGWLPSAMWGQFKHMILPTIALAGFPMAFVARLTRSSMLEVMQQDYIRTAKSKGLSQRVIIYRHALKNSLIPVITYLGPLVAGILTGSFVVEKMFAIPGLGRYFVQSINNRDYTVIMGITFFDSLLLVGLNFLVDLAYTLVDPRIRLMDGRK
ncbi:MAG: ABC transporter permease [Bacillota bacterium]|jgi:oligopeptide transport system permease protein